MGLENDLHDPCLFTWRKNGELAVILLYVDDMLIASNSIDKLNDIKSHLKKAFQMKDLGEPNTFLGITIQRDRERKEKIIHQADYTERMLEKFNMNKSHPQKSPMVKREVKIKIKTRKSSEINQKEYRIEKRSEV